MLRKKPPGRVLASAHAVEREFRVLAALRNTEVKCFCIAARVVSTHAPGGRRLVLAQRLAAQRRLSTDRTMQA